MNICHFFQRSLLLGATVLAYAQTACATDFPAVISAIKPSVVAIGTIQRTRNPAVSFTATGFVVGDGLTIITNAHAINAPLNIAEQETLCVLIGVGDSPEPRVAVITAVDEEHDLARLKIGGTPLPALKLGDISNVVEGEAVAFTGFPLAIALGHQHTTHRGYIAAMTPITRPALGSARLNSNVIAQLRRSPFTILQLDATAYPGNSGSPLYDAETGTVIGIINMVFVKGLKETAITDPSGISYAIPVNYIRDLMQRK